MFGLWCSNSFEDFGRRGGVVKLGFFFEFFGVVNEVPQNALEFFGVWIGVPQQRGDRECMGLGRFAGEPKPSSLAMRGRAGAVVAGGSQPSQQEVSQKKASSAGGRYHATLATGLPSATGRFGMGICLTKEARFEGDEEEPGKAAKPASSSARTVPDIATQAEITGEDGNVIGMRSGADTVALLASTSSSLLAEGPLKIRVGVLVGEAVSTDAKGVAAELSRLRGPRWSGGGVRVGEEPSEPSKVGEEPRRGREPAAPEARLPRRRCGENTDRAIASMGAGGLAKRSR